MSITGYPAPASSGSLDLSKPALAKQKGAANHLSRAERVRAAPDDDATEFQARYKVRVVEAESFVLRDATGTKGADLGMDQDNAALYFFGPRGQQSSFLRRSAFCS